MLQGGRLLFPGHSGHRRIRQASDTVTCRDFTLSGAVRSVLARNLSRASRLGSWLRGLNATNGAHSIRLHQLSSFLINSEFTAITIDHAGRDQFWLLEACIDAV